MTDEINRDEEENNALSKDDLDDVTGGADTPKKLAAAAGAIPAGKGGTNPLHPAVVGEAIEPSAELPGTDSDGGGEG